MAIVPANEAGEHACPFRAFEPCLGPKCMAWSWAGPSVQHCDTDNLRETADGPRPEGEPKPPEGDGWLPHGNPYPTAYHRSSKDKLPKATAQQWVKKLGQPDGYCARTGSNDGGWF